MPTDLLPLRVEHFLLRACPTAVLAAHDIVSEAVRRNLRDEDVISQLVREYNCDRMGFPIGAMPHDDAASNSAQNLASGRPGMMHSNTAGSDPDAAVARRRRMLINYYITNKMFPIDLKKIDVLCDDRSVSDGAVLAGLKGKYGLTELGYPCPKATEGEGEDASTTNHSHSGGGAGTVSDSNDPLLSHLLSSSTVNSKSAGLSGSSAPTMAAARDLAHRSEVMALRHEVELLFLRAAPQRFAEAKGVYDSYERLGGLASRDDLLASVRRSLGSCASDGWPLDADKRRIARLQRFFLNNDPSRLYERSEEVTALVNSKASEHAIFLELYYAYGRDELGRDIEMDQYLHDEVSLLLSRCRPVSATEEFVCTYLALGERKGWEGERLLQFLRELFDCDRDGWPLEIRQRIRSKTLRYLMLNAPEDVPNVDAVLNELVGGSAAGSPATLGGWHGEGLNEALIMTRLYERYGRNEHGKPVLNAPATRFRVCELLEQYVPESEVERLADAALGLHMYPDTLMNHLKQQYSTFTPYPNELRWKLRTIYKRASPDKLYQVDQLMRVKRVEKIPDATIIKAVCRKLNCGPDGWPADPLARRRKRLQLFFERYDPPRLVQIELLLTKDPRSEEQLMHDLERQYNASGTAAGGGGHPSGSIAVGGTALHSTSLFSAEHSYITSAKATADDRRGTTLSGPTASRFANSRSGGLVGSSSEVLFGNNSKLAAPWQREGGDTTHEPRHNGSDVGMSMEMSPIRRGEGGVSTTPPRGTVHTVTAPRSSTSATMMDGSPRRQASLDQLGIGNVPQRSSEGDTFEANQHRYKWLHAGGRF